MKRIAIAILYLYFLIIPCYPQNVVRLYEGKAPGSEDWDYTEVEFSSPGTKNKMFRNVVDPTLEIFMPEKSISTGTAVIVCPGGGNVWLSYESEGTAVAEWLVKKGITAFVLKYRLNKTPEDPEEFEEFWKNFGKRIKALESKDTNSSGTQPTGPPITAPHYYGGDDGITALKYVKENAEKYNIDPDKVGIMGFSAGAGVTMHVIMNSAPNTMPAFAGLIYGGWLKGEKVPENAPPVFILCAADDPISSNSPDTYKAWREAGKSAELHIYSKGGHGFGMDKYRRLPINNWIERFDEWLNVSGY